MKRFFLISAMLVVACALLEAAALNRAEVTVVVNDVRLSESSSSERKAHVQDVVQGHASLNTGVQSRAEMMFEDKTLARIGANTSFSFEQGTRNMDLKYGTMLLQVPKNVGGATIRTAAVTAAITGTTILIEYNPGHHTKVIVLEGTLRLYLKNQLGESVLIKAGQMILLDPKATILPEPVDVDIKRLVLTSRLIRGVAEDEGGGGSGVGNLDLGLVDRQILSQEDQKRDGVLTDTNLLILGEGRDTVIANDELLAAVDQAIHNNPNIGLAKYGPIVLIPGPYTVNNSTMIVTDPMITTGGVTDAGSLYNPSILGSTSQYLFGNTSSFDKAIDFDITRNTWGDIACFKFGQLTIQGAPTVNTANGASSFGFCSQTSISTAGSPFSWNLNGLRLGLIAENGNVTLSGASLSSLSLGGGELYAYARGVGHNLSISSPINAGGGSVNLNAEQDVNLTSSIQGADRCEVDAGRNFSYNSIQAREFEIKAGLVSPSTVVVDSNLQFIGVGHSIYVAAPGIQLNGALDYTTAVRSEFSAGSLGLATSGTITGVNQLTTTGALTANGDLTNIFNINAATIHSTSGNISGGDKITTTSDIKVDAGGLGARAIDSGTGNIMVSGGLVSEDVTAGGIVTVGSSFVKTFSGASSLTVGAGGIQPHSFSIPATVHDYTADSIRSDGGIQGFRGSDATTLLQAGNGYTLHLNINNGVVFSGAAGSDTIVGPVNLSGGDGSTIRPQAGDGGSLYVSAGGVIDVQNTDIRACPGAPKFSGFEGKGGSIELVSGTAVNVGSTGTSKMSVGESAITTPPPYPATSADGGLIRLKSLASSGTGIKVQNSSQLLAIVSSSASPSRIELMTSGSDIQVDEMCKIDAGTVGKIVMDTTSSAGNITLGNGGANIISMNADIVRMRAGQNMTLQYVTMNAPTSISLYAGNLLDFQSGVSLFSPNIILSSPTISFASPVTISSTGVTINAYTSTPVSGANFTGGAPTINNHPAGTAPTFVP